MLSIKDHIRGGGEGVKFKTVELDNKSNFVNTGWQGSAVKTSKALAVFFKSNGNLNWKYSGPTIPPGRHCEIALAIDPAGLAVVSERKYAVNSDADMFTLKLNVLRDTEQELCCSQDKRSKSERKSIGSGKRRITHFGTTTTMTLDIDQINSLIQTNQQSGGFMSIAFKPALIMFMVLLFCISQSMYSQILKETGDLPPENWTQS